MRIINQRAKERELLRQNNKYSNLLENKYNSRPDSKASQASSASPRNVHERLYQRAKRPNSREIDEKLYNILYNNKNSNNSYISKNYLRNGSNEILNGKDISKKKSDEINLFQNKANVIERKLDQIRKRLGSPNSKIKSNVSINENNLSKEMNNKLI